MNAAKIAVSIDSALLKRLDYFIKQKRFKTRSQAIQNAVAETIIRLENRRLATECEKLDVQDEQKLSEEGLDEDQNEWPEF